MGFDPWNRSLKNRDSIGTPTPKVKVHLGVWRFNSPTLPYSQPPMNMMCDSQASLLARIFASLYFRREPKAKVATYFNALNVVAHKKNKQTYNKST